MSWLKRVRRILGALTDILLRGRERGWWDRGHGPPPGGISQEGPR